MAPLRAFFSKFLKIFLASVKAFIQDECYLKAALLTFYFLVSLVPFLAIALSVAKSLGLEDYLQRQILATFEEQSIVLNQALNFAYSLLQHIKTEFFALFGALFLFFGVFGLIENIDRSVNDIWKIKKRRGYFKSLPIYFLVLLLTPIFFISSTAITLFVHTEFAKLFDRVHLPFTGIISLAPYVLMWIFFSAIYLITPYTKIRWKPRIIAGILAGTLFQLWQILYIFFQVYISSYNAIYGSFAALPFFLIWMQVNFIILLFGAEIAAHLEKARIY